MRSCCLLPLFHNLLVLILVEVKAVHENFLFTHVLLAELVRLLKRLIWRWSWLLGSFLLWSTWLGSSWLGRILLGWSGLRRRRWCLLGRLWLRLLFRRLWLRRRRRCLLRRLRLRSLSLFYRLRWRWFGCRGLWCRFLVKFLILSNIELNALLEDYWIRVLRAHLVWFTLLWLGCCSW